MTTLDNIIDGLKLAENQGDVADEVKRLERLQTNLIQKLNEYVIVATPPNGGEPREIRDVRKLLGDG